MPNRIIKESICTSDNVDQLSWFEEVLYYRLIVSCDDYGRFDGRIAVIKNRLFPLKENLTLASVRNAINKLASIGLVSLYEFEGKPFLFLPTWNEHQQIRARKSKYPEPSEKKLISNDIKCNQMISNDIICTRNPIQSNTMNPNNESEYYESKSNSITTTTTTDAHACAQAPPISYIYTYLKEEHDVSNAINEASKFEAYNALRGWDCLPNWKLAADLWVSRIKDQSKGETK